MGAPSEEVSRPKSILYQPVESVQRLGSQSESIMAQNDDYQGPPAPSYEQRESRKLVYELSAQELSPTEVLAVHSDTVKFAEDVGPVEEEPIYEEIRKKSIRRRSTRKSKARHVQPDPVYDSVPTEPSGEIEIPSYEQRESRKVVYEAQASNSAMSMGEPVIDPPTAITPAQPAEADPAASEEQSESEYDSEEYSSYYSSEEEEVVPKKKGFFGWGRK